jgi:hypothetical protein
MGRMGNSGGFWGHRRALLGVAVLAMGCGGGSASGTGGSTTTTSSSASGSSSSSGADGGTTAITCTGQPATASLTGTWAAYGQLSVTLQGAAGGAITICPANQVGAATVLLLVTITQDTTDPTKLDAVQASLCSLSLPTVTALVGTCDPTSAALVSTQLTAPPAFIAALPKVAPAKVTGTLGGTMPGTSFTLQPLDVVVGTRAAGSNMPSWDIANASCNQSGLGTSTQCDTTCVSDCTALRDDDGDGNPGVTLDVCGSTPSDVQQGLKCNASSPSMQGVSLQGQAFVDIEVNPQFSGTVKSSCELTGTVMSQVLYNVVGANVRLVGNPITVSSAIESLPTFQVDVAQSKFRMVRIDGMYGAPNWNVDPTQAGAACMTINQRVNEL